MRIFVLGAGATGSLLAQLLERQGHDVWCGDRDPERARRFLGKRSTIAVTTVNARNLHGIVRAARGCQLIVNASASVFNEIVLRAALRLRAHYLDLSSHLTRNPFQPEQFRYAKKFEEKHRAALINTGAAPGLTNLLVKRAADLVGRSAFRAHSSVRKHGKRRPHFAMVAGSIFRRGHLESSRLPAQEIFSWPSGSRSWRNSAFRIRSVRPTWFLAAQDEVATLPKFIPMQDLDVKIGGNEFDRLRRWHKQGKLSQSRGMTRRRFPETSSPRKIAALIRRGILQNARFAASVLVRGVNHGPKEDQYLLIRSDAHFPTLYQIRQQGLFTTPLLMARRTSPRSSSRFFRAMPKGCLRRNSCPGNAARDSERGTQTWHQVDHKVTLLKPPEDDEEIL